MNTNSYLQDYHQGNFHNIIEKHKIMWYNCNRLHIDFKTLYKLNVVENISQFTNKINK